MVTVRLIAAGALATGVAQLILTVLWWSPCVNGGHSAYPGTGLIDNLSLHPTCFARMQESSFAGNLFGLWCFLAVAAVIAAARARSVMAVIAAAVIVLSCPLMIPGYVWMPWDSADLMPGIGVLSSVGLIVGAGLLCVAPVTVTRRPAHVIARNVAEV